MQIHIVLEPVVARFYMQLAEHTGLSMEQVVSDALFKLAAELSLEAMKDTAPC